MLRATRSHTGPWNATTRNPIVLVGTRFDPNTPLRSRDPSACVVRATGSYLVNLTTPPPGTVCPSDRLPFDPDFGLPVP